MLRESQSTSWLPITEPKYRPSKLHDEYVPTIEDVEIVHHLFKSAHLGLHEYPGPSAILETLRKYEPAIHSHLIADCSNTTVMKDYVGSFFRIATAYHANAWWWSREEEPLSNPHSSFPTGYEFESWNLSWLSINQELRIYEVIDAHTTRGDLKFKNIERSKEGTWVYLHLWFDELKHFSYIVAEMAERLRNDENVRSEVGDPRQLEAEGAHQSEPGGIREFEPGGTRESESEDTCQSDAEDTHHFELAQRSTLYQRLVFRWRRKFHAYMP